MDSEYYRELEYMGYFDDPPTWMLYDKDDDQLMEEYDNEVLDSYNAEEDYWVGARYAREGG